MCLVSLIGTITKKASKYDTCWLRRVKKTVFYLNQQLDRIFEELLQRLQKGSAHGSIH
jgi:hypothetical protein